MRVFHLLNTLSQDATELQTNQTTLTISIGPFPCSTRPESNIVNEFTCRRLCFFCYAHVCLNVLVLHSTSLEFRHMRTL